MSQVCKDFTYIRYDPAEGVIYLKGLTTSTYVVDDELIVDEDEIQRLDRVRVYFNHYGHIDYIQKI